MSGRRVLFVTWDGGGNVNPLLALAPRLAAAGYEIEVYGPPSLAGRFGAEGVDYVGRDVPDPWDAAAMAVDVRDECRRVDADVVVVDYMLPGALCGAEAAGRPTAALVHTLYRALLDGGAPGPMAMAASLDGINAARRELGLPEVGSLGDLLDRCARVLVTSPAELDGRGGDPGDGPTLAGNVRYVGPALEPAGVDAGWRSGAQIDDGRELLVVSLGTTPMDELPVLQRVLDATADLPMHVVATLGGHLDAGDLTAPANAIVTGYVRHAAVLPHAALLVTHAGLGTVLAGLAHGVPLVCLPLGREQPDNAAAVERVGAGRVLPPDAPVDEIHEALVDVLRTPGYRTAAQQLAASIGREPTPFESELEALLGETKET